MYIEQLFTVFIIRFKKCSGSQIYTFKNTNTCLGNSTNWNVSISDLTQIEKNLYIAMS